MVSAAWPIVQCPMHPFVAANDKGDELSAPRELALLRGRRSSGLLTLNKVAALQARKGFLVVEHTFEIAMRYSGMLAH